MGVEVVVAIIAGTATICAAIVSAVVSFDKRSTLQKDINIYQSWKEIESADPDFQRESLQELDDDINWRIRNLTFSNSKSLLVQFLGILVLMFVFFLIELWRRGNLGDGGQTILEGIALFILMIVSICMLWASIRTFSRTSFMKKMKRAREGENTSD